MFIVIVVCTICYLVVTVSLVAVWLLFVFCVFWLFVSGLVFGLLPWFALFRLAWSGGFWVGDDVVFVSFVGVVGLCFCGFLVWLL